MLFVYPPSARGRRVFVTRMVHVDFTKSESKNIEEKAKYTPTAMPNVAPSKDDVLDTVTGDIIAPSSEPQAPFGGGASDSWESLL